MLPVELKPEQFQRYPHEAQALALRYLETLRTTPLAFLPSLLREIIRFDVMFPAERNDLEKQLSYLQTLPSAERKSLFDGFSRIALSDKLENSNWVDYPELFVEGLSAHLWATHQMDAFRNAAEFYWTQVSKTIAAEKSPISRFTIAVLGQGITGQAHSGLRKLRPYGIYFTNVSPKDGLTILLDAVASRARRHPVRYAHWYIDGGAEAECDSTLTLVSYERLKPARLNLLSKIHSEIESGRTGPEGLRTRLAQRRPQDLNLDSSGDNILANFNLKVLTENSGTQVFATTFVQLAAREALRRAQPLTLLARFAPRQRQRAMNELLSAEEKDIALDPEGSLIDAEMGAYYMWLNQQRLAGANSSSFLAWFENHTEAVLISPAVPAGTESSNPMDLHRLVELAG